MQLTLLHISLITFLVCSIKFYSAYFGFVEKLSSYFLNAACEIISSYIFHSCNLRIEIIYEDK